MTTSITDARFNVIHHTPSYTSSLLFDDPPETGWSVMPGYHETLDIPPELEPPRLDSDETLPNQIHPSYPFGRPISLGKKYGSGSGAGGYRAKGVGNLLGTIGQGIGMGIGMSLRGGEWSSSSRRGEQWQEWGLDEVIEHEGRREIPPGMAGAKRPPSPPSPAIRPSAIPAPRSMHLRRLMERQQSSPALPNEGFDAPVPNETYDEPTSPNTNGQQQQQQQQRVQQTQQATPVQVGQVGFSAGQIRGTRGGAGGGSERENEDEEIEDGIQEDDEE